MRAVTFFTRLVLGLLFVYAGAIKIWDVGGMQWSAPQFAADIANFRLVGGDFAILLAIFLPWVEIVAGVALILRRLYPGALAVLTGLMLVFTGAVASALARGLDVRCGCFGKAGAETDLPLALARDLVLLGALLFLAVAERYGPHSRAGHSESLLETRPSER